MGHAALAQLSERLEEVQQGIQVGQGETVGGGGGRGTARVLVCWKEGRGGLPKGGRRL